MNREEAFSVLGIDDAEDALDSYEALIFEQQKFLLSNPVLLKTFQSRLKKAATFHDAYLFFEPVTAEFQLPATAFRADEILSRHILNYYSEKNRLKQILAVNLNFPATKAVVNQLIDLERAYVAPFAAYTEWTAENVLVSKEPDIMELLELIRQQEKNGLLTLDQFYEAKDNLPEILQKELKRLSLLPNYLY